MTPAWKNRTLFQQSTLLRITGQLLLKLSKNYLAYTTQNTHMNDFKLPKLPVDSIKNL